MNTTKVLPTLSVTLMLLAFLAFTTGIAFAADDVDEPVVGKAEISESKALGIAEDAYKGNGAFTDIELEMEHGVLVYGIEYTEKDGNEVDVKVNAKTGAIVVIESDATEAEDDDVGDTEEDDNTSTARMQTLINLLNQLIALLKAQTAL